MSGSRPYPIWLPLLLGFLTAVGPLSTDMYLPSFPSMEAALGGYAGSAQVTLATWFAGLAIGQLTQGSLADRYGRRAPLIAGSVLYTLASAGCALAPDLFTLSAMRFVAAVGGSASMVIPRAIVRDLAEGHEAARLMSRLILVMGSAPILAPTLGGLILTVGSWRAIFWFLTIYGALCCFLVWTKLPDTLPPHHRVRLGAAGLLQRYLTVAREPVFLSFALVGGFGMFGMFAYIGGSPPVLIQHFGFTPAHYGMIFGASAAFYIISSQLNPALIRRFGPSRVVHFAAASYLLAALALFLCAMFGLGGVFGVIVPVMVSLACMGLLMPNAAVGALSRHAAQAGSASALMGMIGFCLAALAGLLVGALSDGTARPMGSLMLLGAIGVILSDWLRPAPPRLERRVGTR